MFHELTDKVMDKAFIKAREHVQNSYSECKSNDAWIEEKQYHFMKCTQTLKISIPWLWEYLTDIEHVAIQNTSYSTLETQIWEQMEDVSIDQFGSDGFKTALFYIKTASAASLSSNLTCSEVRHFK